MIAIEGDARMNGIENIIQSIYEIKKHAIVTPMSLLDNAKLDNYSYVKYFRKDKESLIVEMECICEDGIKRVFDYIFDNNDNLLKIKATPGNLLRTDILFDREIELSILLSQYKEKQDELLSERVG